MAINKKLYCLEEDKYTFLYSILLGFTPTIDREPKKKTA